MNGRLLAGLLALSVAAACAEPVAPELETDGMSLHRSHDDERGVSALTQNLYIGADVDVVIGALASPDPSDDLPALIAAITTLGETVYPLRAGAIAGAITRLRPSVVGLQEVTQLDIDLTALGLPITIHQDFLGILRDSLAARGLHYAVAATVRNTEAQPVPGIGLVDYDAILVDADRVTVSSTATGTYAANIGVVAPGVELKRGWTLARVRIGGRPYVFANTHLESGDGPGLAGLRAAQASELASLLPRGVTVFLLGDLNDGPGSPMDQAWRQAGFIDTWAALRRRDAGPTCCQPANLANDVSALDRRFDYIRVRPAHGPRIDGETYRVGALASERIAGPAHPVWPSDHAGVFLRLR